ncbi:hypothetical protein [Mesorhizobium sp.]|uniref:hypothetical protein n=1 Tax=Mesorhizobium sp. TaxID=1871066 RepID=UPI000FE4A79B|nr:hypothetical protein [Mesorhizobium sp.]RWP49220.1 MAG: hypothetical protein EOR05_11560 [Mesorhizobium sp.]
MRFAFFKDSETIALTRLQMIVGLVAAILIYVDPQVEREGSGRSSCSFHGLAIESPRRREHDLR